MYCYGGALVGAGLLGLDKGVPAAGPAPLLPLSAGLGGAMLLFGYLSTPSGPQPPRKGERGFGLCVAAAVARCDAGCAERSTRLRTLQVHGGGAPGSAHAPRVRRCVAGVLAAASRAPTDEALACGAAVFAHRAYIARAFTHNAGSLAGLSVRARRAWGVLRSAYGTAFRPRSLGASSPSCGLSRSSPRRKWSERARGHASAQTRLCYQTPGSVVVIAVAGAAQPASSSLRSRKAHALGRHASLVDSCTVCPADTRSESHQTGAQSARALRFLRSSVGQRTGERVPAACRRTATARACRPCRPPH